LLGGLLAVVVLLVYARVGHYRFVDYDDPDYVFNNSHVTSGLSAENLLWAFRSGHAANWHPATWISHMVDCQLFGVNAGPQHLVSVLLHAANTVLLFVVFFRMTGFPWRSATVAALFGLHPQHVESVAWIAERKDVLCGFFWCLTLLAYHRYATRRTWTRYLVVALFLALALMSKPMAVTLPCVLLLLDYWPLNRLRSLDQLKPLLLEKTPLLALSAGASITTFLVQKSWGAVVSDEHSSLLLRVGRAIETYFFYLGKTFWPRELFVPYWYEYKPEFWPLAGMSVMLALLTFAALKFGVRHRFLPVGWFWFLGTLVPVVGLVQVGAQSAADRYTYLPSIGLFVVVTWGAADLLISLRTSRWVIGSVAMAIIAICGIVTFRQAGYWKNSETLFRHTLAADPPNLLAMDSLAWSYATDPDPQLRNGARAVRLAEFCAQVTQYGEPASLRVLAAAYAESHQFALAVETVEAALRLPERLQRGQIRIELQTDLKCYQAGRANHAP
jgi:hypothetical protein